MAEVGGTSGDRLFQCPRTKWAS